MESTMNQKPLNYSPPIRSNNQLKHSIHNTEYRKQGNKRVEIRNGPQFRTFEEY